MLGLLRKLSLVEEILEVRGVLEHLDPRGAARVLQRDQVVHGLAHVRLELGRELLAHLRRLRARRGGSDAQRRRRRSGAALVSEGPCSQLARKSGVQARRVGRRTARAGAPSIVPPHRNLRVPAVRAAILRHPPEEFPKVGRVQQGGDLLRDGAKAALCEVQPLAARCRAQSLDARHFPQRGVRRRPVLPRVGARATVDWVLDYVHAARALHLAAQPAGAVRQQVGLGHLAALVGP